MASANSSSSKTPLDGRMTKADNWCRTRFNILKFNYVWILENFSCCVMTLGEVLKSSSFSADPSDKEQPKWCLRMYPKGEEEGSSEFLAVYLNLIKSNKIATPITAKHKMSILNAKGEKTNVKWETNRFEQGEGFGYEKFIRRSALRERSNELLPEDRLSIFCEVTIALGTTNVSGHSNMATPSPIAQIQLSSDMAALLEKSSFSDCVLCSDGQEFKVHRAVLASRSPVFAAMFDSAETHRVAVEDVTAPVLGQLLHFVYTGCEPKLLAEQDMAEALLAAADKYQLDRLKAICEQQLSNGLNKDNVCAMLELADRHNAEHLKAKSMQYVNLHSDEVMGSEAWPAFVASHPELFKQLFKFKVNTAVHHDSKS